MKQSIIEYKTAELAIKKGFDLIESFHNISSLYTKDKKHTYYFNYGFYGSGLNDGYITAPSQAFLQKWLREKHYIILNIQSIYVDEERTEISGYMFWFAFIEGESKTFPSYEEALEEGLIKGLNLIK